MLIPLQWNSFWPALLAVTLAGTVVTAAPHAIIKRASSADTWSPPTSLVKPLPQVWDHEIATYSNALGFKNYGYDQVIATNGSLNFCVRWESNATVTSQDRADIEAAVKRSMKKWIDWLVGFDNFPFTEVKVQVVGWAVYAPSLLKGDTSGIQVYTDKDAAGVPQCSEECGRVFHQDSNYAACKAGAARHYDQSLWLTEGMSGGAGGDWGQRMGKEYFMSNVKQDNITILLHEMGHTFALDDFYDWMPDGITSFIMNSGSSMFITDFDGWMLRDWWRHIKSRYNL